MVIILYFQQCLCFNLHSNVKKISIFAAPYALNFILLEDNVRYTDMQICVCMRSPVSACLICLCSVWLLKYLPAVTLRSQVSCEIAYLSLIEISVILFVLLYGVNWGHVCCCSLCWQGCLLMRKTAVYGCLYWYNFYF